MCLLLVGCASTPPSVGSSDWRDQKMAEIEDAYKNNKLTYAEYMNLKMQTEQIRLQRKAVVLKAIYH